MTVTSAGVNSTTHANYIKLQTQAWDDAAKAWFAAAGEFRALLQHKGEDYAENSKWLDMRNRGVYALVEKAVLLETVAKGNSSEYIWRAKIAS
jgi:hypothetical protein